MKFSYSLLKKLVPAIKSPAEVAEALTMGLFEVGSVSHNAIEVKILPNRYSDAASHWGLAREISALYRVKFQEPRVRSVRVAVEKRVPISVETKTCRRMMAQYFSGVKIAPSPKWMQKVLIACGMRPINNLVDITNYVSLETGQPLHAFDFQKFADSRGLDADLRGRRGLNADGRGKSEDGRRLIVRQAKKGELVELLDGTRVHLDPSVAVLADEAEALDIAGIKGGQRAEITDGTREILLTAGNFDGISIYKASRKTGVMTDASLRFSHNLSPELAEVGINRAIELIEKLCAGKAGFLADVYPKKTPTRPIRFDMKRVNKLLGTNITEREVLEILKRLGFSTKGKTVMPPALRTDSVILEDLAEEIARLYGYDRISPAPPHISLQPAFMEWRIVFNDKVRELMYGFGFDEVYNTSFVDQGVVEIANPIASDKNCLRSSLFPLLLKNIEDNFRFFNEVSIFEIGNVFSATGKQIKDTPDLETLTLGVACGAKKKKVFFELKGVLEALCALLGCAEADFRPKAGKNAAGVEIFVSGREVGYISRVRDEVGIAEINLDALMPLAKREARFTPLQKYPAVERDISLLIPNDSRIGEIMGAAQRLDKKIIRAVRLIDEYANPEWKGRRSVTFRVVLQRDDRTLTSEEANQAMEKISALAREEFDADIR